MIKIAYVVGLIIFVNLILTLHSPCSSIVTFLSTDCISNDNLWEVRGQIGDVISGHFTALAFIGLLISLQHQRKSLEQMGETIGQQNQNLIQQSTALELQIKEFQQQTAEFKTNNYLQIIDRNYLRLNSLEESFGYRDILNGKNCKIAFRDLEMLVYQLQTIKNNIELVSLADTKETLLKEFDIYKSLYYENKIEPIIYMSFFIKEISPIIGSDFNRNEYGEELDGIKDSALKIDEIAANIVRYLAGDNNDFSTLEKQLAQFFIEYFKKNKSDFSTFLNEYPPNFTPDIFKKYFKINYNLIWENHKNV